MCKYWHSGSLSALGAFRALCAFAAFSVSDASAWVRVGPHRSVDQAVHHGLVSPLRAFLQSREVLASCAAVIQPNRRPPGLPRLLRTQQPTPKPRADKPSKPPQKRPICPGSPPPCLANRPDARHPPTSAAAVPAPIALFQSKAIRHRAVLVWHTRCLLSRPFALCPSFLPSFLARLHAAL